MIQRSSNVAAGATSRRRLFRAATATNPGGLPYLLLLPALLAIGAIIFYPLAYSIALSFYELHLLRPTGAKFVGLANYARALGGLAFWRSLGATLQYIVGSVALSFLLGLGTALMLNVPFRGRGVARAMIIIPWATPWLVTTLIWYIMFNPQVGPLNEILQRLGVIQTGIPWLYQSSTAMAAIILTTTWRIFPSATLLMLTGLQAISPELYEAAAVDGAGRWQRFRFITLPGLRAVNLVVLVLLTINTSKLFTVAWVLTQGGPGGATRLLSVYIYEESFKYYRIGSGSTLSTLLLLFSAGLVIAYFKLLGIERKDEA